MVEKVGARYPFLFGALAFFSTTGGGLLVIQQRKRFGVILAFAGSIVIAVSLLDLLPESLDLATGAQTAVESVVSVVAIGFVVLLVLERYLSVKTVVAGGENKYVRQLKGGWLGTSEIAIHN